MSRQFSRIALAGLALLAAAVPSRSAVLTFTDLASWQAAVGASPTFVEGFDEFASDTSFVSAPVAAGPLTLSHTGSSDFRNIIDVLPLEFGSTITTNAASCFTDFGTDTIQMSFSSPIYAWAADFSDTASGEKLDLVFTSTSGTTTVQQTVNTGFFGFVTTPAEAFSSLTFQSRLDLAGGEGFFMDNVRGAAVAVAVPEASTFALALPALGMIGAIAIKRRKK